MKITTLTIMLLTILSPAAIQACTCMPPPPPLEALAAADAVFLGTLMQTEDIGEFTTLLTFLVTSSWKGVSTTTVVIETARDDAMCGYPHGMCDEHLIYATESQTSGRYWTDLCTRSRCEAWAQDDFDALGAPGVVHAESSTWGTMKGIYR